MYEVARGTKTQNGPYVAMIIIGSKRPEADVDQGRLPSASGVLLVIWLALEIV